MGRPHTGPSIDTRCHHCHLMSLDGSTRLKCHCHVAAVRARLSTICHSYYYFIRPQCRDGSAWKCDPRPLERIITDAWDTAPGAEPRLQPARNCRDASTSVAFLNPHPSAFEMFCPSNPFCILFFFTNGITFYSLALALGYLTLRYR